MRYKRTMPIVVLLAAFLLLSLPFAALAASEAQVQTYATPTPGADGRIIYVVQEGDNCLRISLMTGVSMDYIRQTNHLDENCTIRSGQELVIGIGAPPAASPTPGPSPTPTGVPTAIPPSGGTAEVCVALYNDSNGDGLRQANTDALGNYLPAGSEPIVAGGAISLTSLTGTYSRTLDAVEGYDPVCFTDVPDGQYSVSAAVPDGYNPTTVLNYSLEVIPGDTTYVSFGAQVKSQTPTESVSASQVPILGILGALLLLVGIGLGIFAWRTRK